MEKKTTRRHTDGGDIGSNPIGCTKAGYTGVEDL